MTTVADIRAHYEEVADRYSEEVLRTTAKLRRDLDHVDAAIESDHRVAASVSGETFAESSARDVFRAIAARQNAYDVLSILGVES